MPAVRGYWILDDLDEGLGFGEMFPGRRDLGGLEGFMGGGGEASPLHRSAGTASIFSR